MTGDWMDFDITEMRFKFSLQNYGRVLPQMRRVTFILLPEEEPKTIAQAERVWHRPDEATAWPENPTNFSECFFRESHMLHHLRKHNHVEGPVSEWQRFGVHIHPVAFAAEPFLEKLQRRTVNIHPNKGVA